MIARCRRRMVYHLYRSFTKMSRIKVATANRDNDRVMSLFPKVKQSVKDRFREFHDDEELVRRKAAEFRQVDRKYQSLTDDYDVCIYYLVESYMKTIDGNIRTTGESFSGLLSLFPFITGDNPKALTIGSTIGSAVQKNSGVIARIFENAVPPTLTLYDSDFEGEIIPRDAKSVSEVKSFLEDVGLPENISNSAGDCINDGLTFKSVYAFVSTSIAMWMNTKPVGTKGLRTLKAA